MGWWRKGLVAVASVAVVGACLAEYDEPTAEQPAHAEVEPAADVEPGADQDDTLATVALAALTVKGRAPMTGYSRERFGQAWLDADRNGCDTRNDMLRRHLLDPVVAANGCVVTSGVREDPYTGTRIDFVRGQSALLDVDHVVALGNAWATGAFAWGIHQRAAFGNDPLNLLPVDSGANRQKKDADAATWLPGNKAFRCEYVSRQIAVKTKYDLWVTPPEAAAMERILASCPGEPLVVDVDEAPTEVTHRITDPGPP